LDIQRTQPAFLGICIRTCWTRLQTRRQNRSHDRKIIPKWSNCMLGWMY